MSDDAREWFDRGGWRHDLGVLRGELHDRGADTETVDVLVDQAAGRQRDEPPPSEPTRPARRPRAPKPESRNGAERVPAGSVPPQNREAEEAVLGACMVAPAALKAARTILRADGREFYLHSHAAIWRACVQLDDQGVAPDAITVVDHLDETGQLETAGGRVRVYEIANLVPATANVAHYARIVAEVSQLRDLIDAGSELSRLGWDRPGDIAQLLEQAQRIVDEATRPAQEIRVRDRFEPGGEFAFAVAQDTATVWGDGDDIAWIAGEGLMLCGPQGVGKTTVMQQLALARCGLLSSLLGLPVAQDERRVLYIAADRPAQAQRSLRRMVADHNRADLDERMRVHRGPPEQLLNSDPGILSRLARDAGAGTVFIDSLKDMAIRLADDDSGAQVNLAYQRLVADGVELVVGHHQRKATGDNRRPDKLDDVYGSAWLTAGLGSVILLWGEPGDLIVELHHLKQPRDMLGPWNLRHDHARGITTVNRRPELLEYVRNAGAAGISAQEVAALVYEKADPSRNEVERIRNRLDRLTDQGRIGKEAGQAGGGGRPAIYRAAAEAGQ